MIIDLVLFSTMALGARGVFAASPWPTDVAGWLALGMVTVGAVGLAWRGVRAFSSAADRVELVPEHAEMLVQLTEAVGKLGEGQERIEGLITDHTAQDEANFAALNLRFNELEGRPTP